jgi:MoaA/NifB/PqqE/SkfB family radical SAM enzyme
MSDEVGAFPNPLAEYGPLAKKLFQKLSERQVPFYGSIELTHRCNLACRHCYVNLPAADRGAQQREMTTEQICRILDELAELGTFSVTLTGGEPLLRPDFAEIYRHAHDQGLLVTVYTNATLITDDILKLWTERPPSKVDITQYGFTAATYDLVADAGDGQHARFERGVRRLVDAGVYVSLKSVAMRSNVHEIPAMRDFAEELAVPFRFDTIISPRIDGGRKPLAERLRPDEVVAVEFLRHEDRQSWAEFCETRVGGPPPTDDLYQCGAGKWNFLIDPYGRMHLCELSRTLGWDVLSGGVANGWKDAFPVARSKKRVHTSGCGTCPTYGGCSNCVGMAELEGLSRADGNPYLCEITDLRNADIYGAARPQPNGLVQLRRRAEPSSARAV